MNPIASFIAHLRASGFSDAQIVVACEAYGHAMELVEQGSEETPRTARQERNARYYAKRLKASENRLKTSYSDAKECPSHTLPKENTIPLESPSEILPPSDFSSANGQPKKRATRLPEDWQPLDDDWDKVKASGLSDDEIRYEHQKFTDWARAAPGQKGVKLDWDATWRNWMRKAADEKRGKTERQKAFDARFGAKH